MMRNISAVAMTSALAAVFALSSFAQTATAQPAPAKPAAVKPAKPAPAPAASAQEIADAKAKGLVWVNLNSKVYHTEGQFYGKTKNGKFMTKADAEKAGYKAAKEATPKKAAAAPPAAKK